MKKSNLLLIFLGIITILAQTILLRELLVEVNGNEIVFSVYLSLWLLFVACGSYLSRFTKSSENKTITAFSLLLISVPLQFYFIRNLASSFTFVSGQMLNLPAVFWLGIIILLPGCLLAGWLFPQLCNLLKNREKSIRQGYVLECTGIVFGSIIFVVSSFVLAQITLLCLLSSTGFLVLYFVFRRKVLLLPTIILFLVTPFSTSIYKMNYSKRYLPQTILSSRDSHFGRLDVTELQEQKNYYWNGELFASTDNEMYAQQMVNFVMLQHPEPQEILLVGGLLNGFIPEILNYGSVQNIDYLEMDANILKQATAMQKVNFIRFDPVRYVQKTEKKYDLIFLDLPDPSSLYLNRFYSQEFFHSLAGIMKDSLSVAAITLSSGTNFMTNEIIGLNATIYHTFTAEFPDVKLIPSSKNIFLGSPGKYISNEVDLLQQRNRLEEAWFNNTVIFEKCNDLRITQILKLIESVPAGLNTISKPRAYLSTILLWTDLAEMQIKITTDFLQSKRWLVLVAAFIFIFFIGLIGSRLSRSPERRLDLNIFSISLVNFVMELVLINLFQMRFGYVYFVIFLFTASFMIGLIAGFWCQKMLRISFRFIWLINLLLIAGVDLIFPLKISAIFIFLCNLVFALLEGLLLAKLLSNKQDISGKGSTFYFLDSLGAMTGGIVVSIGIFPLFGLQSSLFFLSGILLINLLISLKGSPNLPDRKQ
ncbi:MAG: hypothetical protein Q7J16_00675 [Candidatus Cloacimonadales bacterium]|nr:hypothetical protein [Candidatus Cloacimonadales bacterium]